MWLPPHNRPGDARLPARAMPVGLLLLCVALPGVSWAAGTATPTGHHPQTASPGKHVGGHKGLLGLPRHARSTELGRTKPSSDAAAKTKHLKSLAEKKATETATGQPKTLGLNPLSGTGFPTRTPQMGAIRPPPKPGGTIGGSSFNTHR